MNIYTHTSTVPGHFTLLLAKIHLSYQNYVCQFKTWV